MRTTIELSNEQRAALLSLAAHRGVRGYSPLIQEALDRYLGLSAASVPSRKRRTRRSLGEDILTFLSDGFSTHRKDGSTRHDDYIYRGE